MIKKKKTILFLNCLFSLAHFQSPIKCFRFRQ